MQELRDPVHGFVQFNETELEILNLPIMQRLRRIRQLAFANLLYPGAVHTRFDHSIGVFHVAGLLAKTLKVSDEDAQAVRLAALLHDAGHGPFSHVSEELLERYGPESREAETDGKVHERITLKLVTERPEITERLGSVLLDRIGNVLRRQGNSTLLSELISGAIDADRQDYLLRDSYFCGVKYGIYDIGRLHNTLRVIEDTSQGDFFLGIAEDGIDALEQFSLARYHMTQQVYRHRVRLITDAMIIRAISTGIDDEGIDDLSRLFQYEPSSNYVENYVKFDDNRLIQLCLRTSTSKCRELFTRLINRDLFKLVFHVRTSEFSEPARNRLVNLRENPTVCGRVEERIAELLNLDRRDVIVNTYFIRSAREQTRGNEGELPIYPANPDQPTRLFSDASPLFRNLNPTMDDSFVDIYAPLARPASPDDRRARLEMERQLFDILESELGRGEDQ